MEKHDLANRYVQRLTAWPQAMRPYLHRLPDHGDLACFGPGDHGHWSMQANNTAAAALAVLGSDPTLDAARAGLSADAMQDWALRLMRFSLSSHRAGDGCTTSGEPWGLSWISALSLERMMHGFEALNFRLDAADRDRLERVLTAESDWLVDCYYRGACTHPGSITAGKVEHNHPENNLWNGCLLYRTAQMFPDTPRRDDYLERANAFLLNGISVDADAVSDQIVAGRPLSAWHVGANFFSTYALNHHGYLNVGYMMICLSNIAMLHFSCRINGWEPPLALYHHLRDLWRLVKTCTFPDGRLWRIGGDTRARYCYCQDYAVPAWMLVRDFLGDTDAESFEIGWLSILEKEMKSHADGSFLRGRLATLATVSPLYYVRLEGDRAVSMSMGAYWRRCLDFEDAGSADPASETTPVLSVWSDTDLGSALARGRNRLASWTWCAAQSPQGLCLPPWDSSMAEWAGNLSGCVLGMGFDHSMEAVPTQLQTFPGGFVTCGQVRVTSRRFMAEGEPDRLVACIDLACIVLPDDCTMLVFQRAVVPRRVTVRAVKGLFLQIPNDVFNGMRRRAVDADGAFDLHGCPSAPVVHTVRGDWLNLDDCLSVIRLAGPGLVVHQPTGRQIEIRGKPEAGGTLHADEICCGCSETVQTVATGAELFDVAVLVLSGVDAARTQALMTGKVTPRVCPGYAPDLRVVSVRGADDRRYRIAVNFGDAPVPMVDDGTVMVQKLVGVEFGSTAARGAAIVLPAKQVAVLVEDEIEVP